ncbi:HET-domain-containing protein [Lophiostoma macrostomum CBS 122681]|uniref:HET-domain-containing protein n=1 Tax=Lophiostoma macrostomum CBS 122681 TaxID=1314788 RepID=A0A6A6SQG5_9PLEO|nr:HET-domain-containing protein [Lophiostoma macrostomum CBS 122681]
MPVPGDATDCRFCGLLYEIGHRMIQHSPTSYEAEDNREWEFEFHPFFTRHPIAFTRYGPVDRLKCAVYHASDEEIPEGSPFFNCRKFRHMHEDTASEECLAFAATLFRDCYSSHLVCGQSNLPVLPSRVLRIPDDPQSSGIRLLDSRGQRGIYAALSHCWGKPPTLRTTKYTLDRYHQWGIHWLSLPKTFQDAVALCRALGFSYLWIDALCILQDSRSDWETESARMRDVYEGATLVIGASMASSDDDGFLGKRPGHFRAKGEPLARRAWTYQERFLSRRYMSFTSQELRWRCLEGIRCECGLLENIPPNCNPPFEPTLYTIKDYTNRKLTNLFDRLPAISAIAKTFQDRIQDAYLAGLWRQDIRQGLLWRSAPSGRKLIAGQGYRAPSWSWASIDGSISYDLNVHRLDMSVNVIDAQCTPLGTDPTGEISTGYLIVESFLLKATICLPCPEATSVHLEWRLWDMEGTTPVRLEWRSSGMENSQSIPAIMHQDCQLESLRMKVSTDSYITAKRATVEDDFLCKESNRLDEGASQKVAQVEAHVWCLLFGRTTRTSIYQDADVAGRWVGLVLTESENYTGRYVRIGWLWIETRDMQVPTDDMRKTITIV